MGNIPCDYLSNTDNNGLLSTDFSTLVSKHDYQHIQYCTKGQKIRDPEFGTDLIKFIFEPDDTISIESIKNEINEAVHRYIDGINVNNISILKSENDFSEIYVKLSYTISNGIENKNENIVIKM